MSRYRKFSTSNALLLITLCLTQYTLCQEVRNEEELNGNAKILDLSSQGLKMPIDLTMFTELEEVDLSNNALFHIDRDHFAENRKLKKIDLSGNTMLSFPDEGSFIESSVKVLNMSNCNIERILDHALDGLKHLEVLDLRENPISFEESTAFEVLESPPKRLIVSKIIDSELSYICKHVDMLIEIIDANMTVECKNVRRETDTVIVKSSKTEKMSRNKLVDFELVDEQFMNGDTHMELLEEEMQADDPMADVGSGADSDSGILLDEVSEKSKPPVSSPSPDEDIEENQSESEPAASASEEDDETVQIIDLPPSNPKDEGDILETVSHAAEEEQTGKPEKPYTDDQQINERFPNVPKENDEISEQKVIVPPLIHHNDQNIRHEEITEVRKVNPLQRSKAQQINISPVKEKSEDIIDPINTGENKTDTSTNVSKNVIIGLIVGAVIMGSVFVGVKLYKDHKSYQVVNRSDDPNEGKEMQTIVRPENKPLMMDNAKLNNHHYDDNIKDHSNQLNSMPKGDSTDGANGRDSYQFSEVVVDEVEKEKSTKEILADIANSGLPDIDDPSRLSTIIVSNTNLNNA